MNILEELRRRFQEALAPLTSEPHTYAGMVRIAQNPRFGDYQANFAMPLAKQLGRNPRDLAAQTVERVDVADLCEPPRIEGPGFINLTLRDSRLLEILRAVDADPRLGVMPVDAPKSIVVDFSSPNVAKPMHVGHLRSTVIGDALTRILRFLGHQVTSDNHIGDWGTQFGMILYGYKHFLDASAYRLHPVDELARLYRLVNQLSEYHAARESLPGLEAEIATRQVRLEAAESAASQDPAAKAARQAERTELLALQEDLRVRRRQLELVDRDSTLRAAAEAHSGIARAARDETARLHAGDSQNRRLWKEFLPACLSALQRIYDRLDIRFDWSLGESFYDPFLAGVVQELVEAGLAVESDGARCVFVEGHAAPFIVQKADGAFTYATTDLATIEHRVREWNAEVILYVVDARQSDHFELLFKTARRWKYPHVDLRHIKFGTVMGENGRPYKTREGDAVGLESLLDQAVRMARAVVDGADPGQRDGSGEPVPEIDEAARVAIAETVGLGGIKYADLRHNRESDYAFSFEKMLATTGDSATYMQYAYARARGILRRAAERGDEPNAAASEICLSAPAERRLALQICRFPEALAATVQEYRPNLLTSYLFELANCFSTFYDECHVLKEERSELRRSRLRLVDLTSRVIRQGLALLGISTCERM